MPSNELPDLAKNGGQKMKKQNHAGYPGAAALSGISDGRRAVPIFCPPFFANLGAFCAPEMSIRVQARMCLSRVVLGAGTVEKRKEPLSVSSQGAFFKMPSNELPDLAKNGGQKMKKQNHAGNQEPQLIRDTRSSARCSHFLPSIFCQSRDFLRARDEPCSSGKQMQAAKTPELSLPHVSRGKKQPARGKLLLREVWYK